MKQNRKIKTVFSPKGTNQVNEENEGFEFVLSGVIETYDQPLIAYSVSTQPLEQEQEMEEIPDFLF